MMSTFFILVWLGGMAPAFRHARRNQHTKFASLINALIWPDDLGRKLADWACSGPDKK